jgi:hypothetical protein
MLCCQRILVWQRFQEKSPQEGRGDKKESVGEMFIFFLLTTTRKIASLQKVSFTTNFYFTRSPVYSVPKV